MNLIDTFYTLVKIDSPSGEENEMRNWLVNWGKKRGLSYYRDKVGNIVLKKQGSTLLPFFLCAHMDTVEPGRQIKPILKNGILQSDGRTILGADNKAAMAAILTAVDKWLMTGPNKGLELVFTIKEEVGGGAEYFDTSLISSKYGYIFDYAEPLGTIVISAPYIINFSVEFIGKGTHACSPEKGINALRFAVAYVNALDLGTNQEKDLFLNIGKIEGGTAINAVPEKITIDGEIRSFSHYKLEKQLTFLKSKLKEAQKEFSDSSFTFNTSGYCGGYEHEEQSQQVQFIEKVLKSTIIPIKKKRVFGISDANSFAEIGLNVVTISDGVVDPHTTSERILLNDLEKLQLIIANMLRNESQFKA